MKNLFLSLLVATQFTSANTLTSHAASLAEPDLNACSNVDGISKCEIKCARSLGDQCLITHIHFEGQNLKPQDNLIRARFLTCKNANLDLQIKSLAVELEKLDERESEAKVTATVSASGNQAVLNEHAPIRFDGTIIDGRLPRTYFKEFINSGDAFVEAEVKLQQCGHPDGSNSCKISGTLVAVTDPNVRCNFHDTSKPGAFVTDKKNGSVGRLGGD